MNIAILGASGNAGYRIAHILAARGICDVTVLGRDSGRLARLVQRLAASGGRDVTWRVVPGAGGGGLGPALASVDLLVVASPTIQHTRAIAETCVASGTDYLDINVSSVVKQETLREIAATPAARERCFITDGGVHPGLPGALVRLAEARIGPLVRAAVAGAFGIDWRSLRLAPDTVTEFVTELLHYDGALLRDARWVKGMKYVRRFDFGAPFGTRQCVPYCMTEIREVAGELGSITDLGFFIAGFGGLVDYVFMPLCMVGAAIPGLRRASGRLLAWSLGRFAGFQDAGAVVVLAAQSPEARMAMRVRHEDVYFMTAAPVVACIEQYLEGRQRPGLWTQAGFVEPIRFAADLERLGLRIHCSTGPHTSD